MTPDDYRSSCTWFIYDPVNDNFLIQQRDNNASIPYPNTWVFPGGDKKSHETPLETSRRELEEELSFTPDNIEEVLALHHHSKKVIEHFYFIVLDDTQELDFKEGHAWQWARIEQISKLNLGWWTREVLPIVNRYKEEFLRRR